MYPVINFNLEKEKEKREFITICHATRLSNSQQIANLKYPNWEKPNMGIILKVDKRGRVTLPIPIEEYACKFMPLWVNGALYLVDTKVVANLTIEESFKFDEEVEKYRVKGLPFWIPRAYEPTNRITIPKVVRVSDVWEFEETTFRFESIGKTVRAYKLTPLKVAPLKEQVVCNA